MKKREAEQIIKLVKIAQGLGREAGEKQYQKLLGEGEQYTVFMNGKPAGGLLDLCGFGFLDIPGNGKIVRAFKKLVVVHDRYRNEYRINNDIKIWKNDKGYALSLQICHRQEISVNREAVRAVAGYLCSQDLECNWRAVID